MLLIKSATIIDGTGKPGYRADVLIKDDRISAIGNFSPKAANDVIDGLGMTLTPGFIDVNTDSDHYLTLFNNPEQQDFLMQGVTTIIGGHCGSSLAPLLYGSLKSVRKWGDISQVNVNWHSVKELKQTLQKMGLSVNFGTLVGHSTIRRDLVGEEFRDLTDSEIDIFKNALDQGMRDGALGLSTGLSSVHAGHVSYSEIKKLLAIVLQRKGVYTTHLRDEKEGILESIREIAEIAQEINIPTIISHLRPIIGHEFHFNEAMELLGAGKSAQNIYFDANPFAFSILPIYTLLPGWARHGDLEEMLSLLYKPEQRARILSEISGSDINFSEITISEAKNTPAIEGQTLQAFSDTRGLSLPQGLLSLMEITGLQALLTYKNINAGLLTDLLFHPKALIGSNAASFQASEKEMESERSTATFSKFLSLAAERGIPPEIAISKITSVPAKILGLQKRGVIAEGAMADIAMFRDGKVQHVLVSGAFAVRDGTETGLRPGIIL